MNKLTVALFHPKGWLVNGHWPYQFQTPGNSGIWENITYLVNPAQTENVDILVVHDDMDDTLRINTRHNASVLVTSEEKSMKQYAPEFLAQFHLVITSRDDLQHPNILRTHYYHPWSVRKTFDELQSIKPQKKLDLSAVISSSTFTEGHKARFAFTNKLKGHFKDDLHWFSKGEHSFVEDKWDGLAAYRFSLAIENSSHDNYFTEKLTDCYLCETLPFYWGCPNLSHYFDDRSYIQVPLSDYKESIRIIENHLNADLFMARLPYVLESKKLFLKKYHFLAALTDCLNNQTWSTGLSKQKIKSQTAFSSNRVKRVIKLGIDLLRT